MSGENHTVFFFWGLGALLIFLIGLLVVDGYLFYFVRADTGGTADTRNSSATLSPRDIDEVTELLDRREREFNSLLNP